MQLKEKSGEAQGELERTTLRYRGCHTTNITMPPNKRLRSRIDQDYNYSSFMLLVIKHLGFTKSCQHLKPKSLEDKADPKAASK